MYLLKQHGKTVQNYKTENLALHGLHRHQSQSCDRAMKYEGRTIEKKPVGYVRKTKDIYILYRRNEEIDETDTREDAKYLKQEYNIAYNGGVSIKKKRQRIV